MRACPYYPSYPERCFRASTRIHGGPLLELLQIQTNSLTNEACSQSTYARSRASG